MIGVIDYGMGNLRSVQNALVFLGYETELISRPEGLSAPSHLILPGVGSYAAAMKNLRRQNLEGEIKNQVAQGKPFLGVCLGMQLMSTTGTEGGEVLGLNLVPGSVVPLDLPAERLVPHVGWNRLEKRVDHPIFQGVKPHIDFYFGHSYQFKPGAVGDVLAFADYGGDLVAAVSRKNAVGLQFHPEKSQDAGLKIVQNFCEWGGSC